MLRSRERVLSTLDHKVSDRVPMQVECWKPGLLYWSCHEIWEPSAVGGHRRPM